MDTVGCEDQGVELLLLLCYIDIISKCLINYTYMLPAYFCISHSLTQKLLVKLLVDNTETHNSSKWREQFSVEFSAIYGTFIIHPPSLRLKKDNGKQWMIVISRGL